MGDSDPAGRPGEITVLLGQAATGDQEAFDRLFPLVYEELKAIAHDRLRFERPGHTLETSALVHEVYVRLVGQTRAHWRNSSQFMAVASEAMRRILVDYAKRRRAAKRGGYAAQVTLDEARDVPGPTAPFSDGQAAELIALDDAMERLAQFNPRGAKIAQFRYFGGLSVEEICDLMGLSERTVRRAWTMGKAWLRKELGQDPRATGDPLGSFAPKEA